MTPPKKHLALALEGEEAGTVLGTVAWVPGVSPKEESPPGRNRAVSE